LREVLNDISQTIDDGRDADSCSLTRRTVIGGLMTTGILVSTGRAWAADASTPQPGDFLIKDKDSSLTPLTPDDIDPASEKTLVVRPVDPATNKARTGNKNKLIAVRLTPEELKGDAQTRAAEGVMVFSAVCTHQGCTVNRFRPDTGLLFCPCHGSQFDAARNGAVKQGPATVRLASLAVKVEDGKLVVAESFDGDVGAKG